ncbi:MAG: hypothetical protein GXY13_01975, partial [Acidimicrobiales bacterium]|nr:hypothetical protein [Acidimicrobiales bacterium]
MREHGTGAVRRTSAGNVETDVGGVTSARSAPDPATRLAELYEALLPVVFGYCRARLREADA